MCRIFINILIFRRPQKYVPRSLSTYILQEFLHTSEDLLFVRTFINITVLVYSTPGTFTEQQLAAPCGEN